VILGIIRERPKSRRVIFRHRVNAESGTRIVPRAISHRLARVMLCSFKFRPERFWSVANRYERAKLDDAQFAALVADGIINPK
jgi:hypothetical protein